MTDATKWIENSLFQIRGAWGSRKCFNELARIRLKAENKRTASTGPTGELMSVDGATGDLLDRQ